MSTATSTAVRIIDIYARISRDNDGTTRSVDSQVSDCLAELAEHPDWTPGEVFRDHALSAWNPKVRRPEWGTMMARLESGVSGGVLVFDLTRFTRKPMEGERLIAAAERGIAVASLDATYNLMDPDSRAHFRGDMTAAARESDKISQRTRRGKRLKARRGLSNVGPRAYARPGPTAKPTGWLPGDPPPEPVPDAQVAVERAVIRGAATELLAGRSLQTVVDGLRARGVRTTTGRPWTAETLSQTLRRPNLAGRAEYKGELVGELPGEPVLEPATWEALMASFAGRRRGRPIGGTFLLTGLISCGRCGRHLNGHTRRDPTGNLRRQYRCQPRASGGGGCGRLTVDQPYADAVVAAAVIARLDDPRHTGRLAKQAARANAKRDRLAGELSEAEDTGRKLSDRLGRGEISFDRFDTAIAAVDRRLAALHADLAAIRDDEPAGPSDDAATRWREAQAAGDMATLRTLVRQTFPRLIILPATGHGPAAKSLDRFAWEGTSEQNPA